MNDTSPESGDNFDGGGIVVALVYGCCFFAGTVIGSLITVTVNSWW